MAFDQRNMENLLEKICDALQNCMIKFMINVYFTFTRKDRMADQHSRLKCGGKLGAHSAKSFSHLLVLAVNCHGRAVGPLSLSLVAPSGATSYEC